MIGGLVGVGIGAIVTNQTLAVTAVLIWTLLVESLLTNFATGIGRWFPGGAASAMSGITPADGALLQPWAAALLFAGYGLAFALVGSRSLTARHHVMSTTHRSPSPTRPSPSRSKVSIALILAPCSGTEISCRKPLTHSGRSGRPCLPGRAGRGLEQHASGSSPPPRQPLAPAPADSRR